MNPRVQFEDEADAEYRLAGRWYEARREHLGLEFFDAVMKRLAGSSTYLVPEPLCRACLPTCQ